MTHKFLKVTINGIAGSSPAGTEGTANLPLNIRVHQMAIAYTDGQAGAVVTPAANYNGSTDRAFNAYDVCKVVGDITLFAGTEAVRTHSADELDIMNLANGSQYGRQQYGTAAAKRDILPIFLAEPWRKDIVDADSGAWVITKKNGFDTFQVVVKLATALPSSGKVELLVWYDEPAALLASTQGQMIKKVRRFNVPGAGTEFEFPSLPVGVAYEALHLYNPTGTSIASFTFKRGQEVFADDVKREDLHSHLVRNGMNPFNLTGLGAGFCGLQFVFDADDPRRNSLMPTGESLMVAGKYAGTSTGNVKMLAEILETV